MKETTSKPEPTREPEADPILDALTTMLGVTDAGTPGVFPGPLVMADALEQIANAIRDSYWQLPDEARRQIDENPATWQDLQALGAAPDGGTHE